MAVTIDKAFVKTYESNVRHLAQQSEAKLRSWVQEKSPGATEEHSFERVGTVSMSVKSSRRAATPEVDTPWSNRVAIPATYDVGDTMEKEDKLKTLIEPNSNIAIVQANAARRQIDDLIIDAVDANAPDNDGVANNFPAGQDVGDYTTEISFDAVTQVLAKFATNELMDEPKVAVIGPNQARKLMHDPKATNFDYVQAKVLSETGFLKSWMGFSWIVSNRLNSPGGNQLTTLFFTRRAMGLLVLEDITTEIGKDPSKSFMWRIYTRLTMGAVRVEDEQIVRFKAKDTVTV